MRSKWREVFEKVGRQLETAEGFDEEWKDNVEEQVREWADLEQKGQEEEFRSDFEGENRKLTLDEDIMRWEVERAIRKVKNGKACGEDRVVGEVLKFGGEWMTESIWELCRRVFVGENIPEKWLKSIKVQVKKSGLGDKFEEYRGVTLTSVVGKVFGMIIEARLRDFCEEKGLLSDYQFGFRRGRACEDAYLVLSELVTRRGDSKLYAGFLDIAKAYDSVWRRGMWYKLWRNGVRGRMWRVVKSLYARCEIGVRVAGEVRSGEWYEEFVGLRQGCVLSPLLFALYINDLPAELEREGGLGVEIGGGKSMRCMLFADDIVILDKTREGLQKSLDVASAFSKKWRFAYNFGRDKTAVMVFGGADDGDRWWLGDTEVDVVKNYKYLGIRFIEGKRGRWATQRIECLSNARKSFYAAWGLGMGKSELSSRGAKNLWETLARPVAEYGAVVDAGRWEEVEKLQRLAARMCLGVGRGVADEVLMGELGWWSVRGRREYLRLLYWGKLASGGGGQLVQQVYREGRKRCEEGVAGGGEWCVEVCQVMDRIGLQEYWRGERVGTRKEWAKMVRVMMHMDEELRWQRDMAGKVKLRLYMRMKKHLSAGWFLSENRVWVKEWVKLIAGVSGLEVEKGRHGLVARRDRLCKCCKEGVLEDEVHFLDVCEGWDKERSQLWEEIRKVDANLVWYVRSWARRDRVEWLMRGGNSKTRLLILNRVVRWLYARHKVGVGRGEENSSLWQGVPVAGRGRFGIGKVVFTRWGDMKIDKIVHRKKVVGKIEGDEKDYTYIIPQVKTGDNVGTKWGSATVVKIHGDGDIECTWEGWHGAFTVGLDEVYKKKRVRAQGKEEV